MTNSPTMCQLYVKKALKIIKNKYPKLKICHYIDNILLYKSKDKDLYLAYTNLIKIFESKGLFITPKKVQKDNVETFLKTNTHPQFVSPQKITIHRDHLKTLNDFQKLLRDIN